MILRLNKVFHPEVLLNKRGPDWDRKLYKFWMAHCRFISEGQFEVTDKNMLKHIAEDPNFGPNLSLWKKFIESKAKTYHFSKSLFETLLDVDSALPVKALPEKFIGYLSFPDGMMVDSDGVAYQGAYVWIDKAEELPIHTEGHKKALMINLVPEDINGGDLSLRCPIPDVDSIGSEGGKYVTIETIGTTVPVDTGPMARMPADGGKSWHRLEVEVIKCVLFLNSDEPDLTALKPLGNQSRTSAKKSGHNFSETSTVPITLVGWNWVRTAPEYRTEMWYRKAHFSTRWTGPGRTVLKPVFVKESWPRRQFDDNNGAPNPGDEDFGSDPNEDSDEILEQDEEIAASMRDE